MGDTMRKHLYEVIENPNNEIFELFKFLLIDEVINIV